MTEDSTALVLLSGGLDSAVTAWIAKEENTDLYAVSFQYGQRHQAMEGERAECLSKELGVRNHFWIDLPLDKYFSGYASLFPGSVLFPKIDGVDSGIPSTWVPQRNMIFLSFAFALAETIDADRVYTGFNAVDYSGYPDCRPDFVLSAQNSLNLARSKYVTEGHRILIDTPIILRSKAEIVREGQRLGVPFELTYSCYYGGELACGLCDSCRIRLAAFKEVGTPDPVSYAGMGC